MTTVDTGSYVDYTATCTQGGKAISGGFTQSNTVHAWLNTSAPNATGGWDYSLTNWGAAGLTAYFVTTCAK